MQSNSCTVSSQTRWLFAIDPEKLKPSPESLKQLKGNILKDAQGEEWLRTKILSLKYDDGFSFTELMPKE